ncbi:MAG: MBL fold metallo-hydrolase [Candidatus Thorarchaeota archaeon]|nr:MBL fold metallo-hydrolase [Candidatus Thorarchaeota archaeon]
MTLLENAGVMIEAEGLRIYIDPILLPDNYTEYPADTILITHPHDDHYHYASIEKIATEDTIFIMPENMSTEVARHDAIAVNPGDSVQVGTINITAFYMYTYPPPDTDYEASHPAENNWTSYIIDINGFTIFHAGDSKDIDEYEQLTGHIDVAMLPLGPGCQSMAGGEVVSVLRTIEPQYFIPIHFENGANDVFCETYDTQIEYEGIEIVNLDHFESFVFESESF